MRTPSLACMALIITSILTSFAESQDRTRLRIRDLMTAEEFKRAGLNKLSAAEVSVLDSWLNTVLDASQDSPKSVVQQRGLARGEARAAAKNYRILTTPRNVRMADGRTASTAMPNITEQTGNAAAVNPALSSDGEITIEQVLNGMIIAGDGQFLGIISDDPVNSKSVSNQAGQYGGAVGRFSIFNEVGKYGGEIGQYSPFSEFSTKPPQIYVNGKPFCYLTVNQARLPRCSPIALKAWVESR